jgi:hypothetical protein
VTEAEFTTRVIQAAQLYGWLVSHSRPALTAKGWRTALQGDRGAPDLVLARGGVVILAELKSERGRLGPGQAGWLEALGTHGRIWRPDQWDAIQAELAKEKQ